MRQNESAPTPKREGAIRPSNPADDSTAELEDRVSELRARATGYAVLVENPAGRYRRRLFLTLESAQRAKDRATARGQYAAILLVKLVPVTGGEFL